MLKEIFSLKNSCKFRNICVKNFFSSFRHEEKKSTYYICILFFNLLKKGVKFLPGVLAGTNRINLQNNKLHKSVTTKISGLAVFEQADPEN
jgi:hypothetical protein